MKKALLEKLHLRPFLHHRPQNLCIKSRNSKKATMQKKSKNAKKTENARSL